MKYISWLEKVHLVGAALCGATLGLVPDLSPNSISFIAGIGLLFLVVAVALRTP